MPSSPSAALASASQSARGDLGITITGGELRPENPLEGAVALVLVVGGHHGSTQLAKLDPAGTIQTQDV